MKEGRKEISRRQRKGKGKGKGKGKLKRLKS